MKNFLSLIFFALMVCVGTAWAQTTGAKPNPASPQKPATTTAPPAATNKKEDCGCEAKTPAPDVFATVNGIKISAKEIEDPLKEKVKEIQNSVVEARKRELDVQINTRLLNLEAKKRGITTSKLIEQEILSKVKEPTLEEAQAFYAQNKAKIQESFDSIVGDILTYLRQQRQQLETRKLAERLRAAAQVKMLVTAAAVTPPEKEADRERLFATLNGEKITSGDVEDALRPLIFEAQEQIYELKKAQLDVRINDLLLEQEAAKRKITTKALLDQEVITKIRKPTEAEARKFYDDNTEKIAGTFAESKDKIIEYLTQQEQQKSEDAFAESLRKTANIEMNLREPDPPVLSIAIDDRPTRGGANAAVTIVEFTDFQCPACGRTQPILDEVVNEYGDRVKFVVRDFPLEMHAYAMKAAEAAEAAREQGKFWEYAAVLFKNQEHLEIENLLQYASQLGLDMKKFQEALSSGKFADKVQRDVEDGVRLGINATPTVFINGKRLRDKSKESLKAAIEAALKEVAKK
ncbi:MAG: thioredoxin domain-containing protein [Acidobacteria bacterium]|nr:thioredoxin domain-containing protein [Acidobacteriota bacterium]